MNYLIMEYISKPSFIGNFDKHYGIFPGCGKGNPFTEGETSENCC